MNINAIFMTVIAACLTVVAYHFGLIDMLRDADIFYIAHVMVVMFSIGAIASWFNKWKTVDYIASSLLVMGLIGTVVGLIYSTSGILVNEITLENLPKLVGALLGGVGVALYTTLTGAVGFLWLHSVIHLCNPTEK